MTSKEIEQPLVQATFRTLLVCHGARSSIELEKLVRADISSRLFHLKRYGPTLGAIDENVGRLAGEASLLAGSSVWGLERNQTGWGGRGRAEKAKRDHLTHRPLRP